MPDSKEYCSKCHEWRLYDNDGHCWICGKQILVKSEPYTELLNNPLYFPEGA